MQVEIEKISLTKMVEREKEKLWKGEWEVEVEQEVLVVVKEEEKAMVGAGTQICTRTRSPDHS